MERLVAFIDATSLASASPTSLIPILFSFSAHIDMVPSDVNRTCGNTIGVDEIKHQEKGYFSHDILQTFDTIFAY